MSLLHKKHKDHQHDLRPAISSITHPEHIGQQQASTRVPRRRSSGLKFFASAAVAKPEVSKETHKTWEAEYLKDLRANRPTRPGGSRPLPERGTGAKPEPYARALSAMSFRPSTSIGQADLNLGRSAQERSASALSHRRAQSYMPGNQEKSSKPAVSAVLPRDFSASTMRSQEPSSIPSGTYRESGMRWMEKQEARSLREALEEMDMRSEAKIHAAAQNEASELVLNHRASHTLRDHPDQPYNYKRHIEKGAHARSQSTRWHAEPDSIDHDRVPSQQTTSYDSASNHISKDSMLKHRNTTITFEDPVKSTYEDNTQTGSGHALWDSPEKKAYTNLASLKLSSKASGRRRSSGSRPRNVSGGLFRNPDDKIYEEPQDNQGPPSSSQFGHSKIPAPLTTKTRNVISKISTTNQPFLRSRTSSSEDKQKIHRFEIQRNPPSQSRNPSYLKNEKFATPAHDPKNEESKYHPETARAKDGIEIRSDDIKAATSMRMKDRSPKLPSPAIVSNQPGRPIVSFDRDWAPKDSEKQMTPPNRPSGIPPRMLSKPHLPKSTASAPIVPTINIPSPPSVQISETPAATAPSIPSISFSDDPVPSISIPDDPQASRALPSPLTRPRPSPSSRPTPHHSSTAPTHSSKFHWSPSPRRATAQCAACALPIEGRIVSAASQRFHPHCFTCHHCAEALECVAFYPEPDSARDARLARIEARANGASVPEEEEKPGETVLDDGDASLRFYCHLDFHELFSPRCRSCKTPIETEVILACGASWHAGHFFCAQCGDPFDAKTPFVEKDGYAWCVACHAGRFSGKCKGCKKPVVDGGVMALGGEWHTDCFCCVVILSLNSDDFRDID